MLVSKVDSWDSFELIQAMSLIKYALTQTICHCCEQLTISRKYKANIDQKMSYFKAIISLIFISHSTAFIHQKKTQILFDGRGYQRVVATRALNGFMEERLVSIRRTFNELTERLADPDVTKDPKVSF